MTDKNQLKTDEITSTERLLNLIRGRSDQTLEEGAAHRVNKSTSKKAKGSLFKSESELKKNSISVGVDIGQDLLRLVKACGSEGKRHLLEHRSVSLPLGVEKDSDAFSDFLQGELVSFCGDAERADIWTAMSSANIEVRRIHIPKVSEAQLEQAVFWTLKKEASFDEKTLFFDYEVLGEVDEPTGRKLRLMCYTAPLEQVERIKSLFSRTGFALTGITIVPFVEQNIFKTGWMETGKYAACLFIGNEYSRIDLFVDGRMALTRDIRTGIKSMIEMTAEALQTRPGGVGRPDYESGTLQTGAEALQAGVEVLQTRQGISSQPEHEKARRVLYALGSDESDQLFIDDSHSVGRAEMESIIAPVLERLVRQVERTFDHYLRNLGYERIGEIYLSSVMPVPPFMVGYFEKQLGIRCAIFDPIGSAMAHEELVERVAFMPAFGSSFSDTAYTPNFIFTYKDKQKKAATERLNRIIFASLLVIVLVCSGIFADLLIRTAHQKKELAQLELQLQKQSPVLSREMVLGMVSQYKEQQGKLKKLGERYAGMAVLSELSSLMPDAIKLSSIKYTSGGKTEKTAKGAGKSGKTKNENAGTVLIEGAVRGERGLADTMLASFVMKLNGSPLFREVTVTKSGNGRYSGQDSALVFTLEARIGPHK
jgi:Tfp pilus assembly PilM family ATPase